MQLNRVKIIVVAASSLCFAQFTNAQVTHEGAPVRVNILSADTPFVRFDQNGGFGAQVWDLAGNEENFFLRDAVNVDGDGNALLPFRVAPAAPTNSIYVADDGNVGIGIGPTDVGIFPEAKLHIKDGDLKIEQSAPSVTARIDFSTATSSWEIKQNGQTGRLTFFSPGGGAATAPFKFDRQAQENLFRVGVVAGDTVDINGKLVINGSQVTPDYVFGSDYRLESIEEHAEFMWEHKHLPALPGAAANEKGGVDIVSHQYGTLEELEKAHIYISQLNAQVKEQAEKMREMELALAEIVAKQGSQKASVAAVE